MLRAGLTGTEGTQGCGPQAEIIHSGRNPNIRTIGQRPHAENVKGFNLVAVRHTAVQVTKCR